MLDLERNLCVILISVVILCFIGRYQTSTLVQCTDNSTCEYICVPTFDDSQAKVNDIFSTLCLNTLLSKV